MSAAQATERLGRYLRETEHMVIDRQFDDRTRYVRDASVTPLVARMVGGFARSHKPLGLKELDIAISAIDAESCLVEIHIPLSDLRAGLVAGILGSSAAIAGVWTLVVWATAVVDPLMMLGVPLVAGSWAGTRAIYQSTANSLQDKVESLLDRIEHGALNR
jgi:hypothetical protein